MKNIVIHELYVKSNFRYKKRVHFHELFSNLERKTGFEPATPTMAR